MSERRIYLVKDSSMLDSHPPRLIMADSQAEVRRHIQRPFVITVPDTLYVLDLVQHKGIVVEKAGAEADADAAGLRG